MDPKLKSEEREKSREEFENLVWTEYTSRIFIGEPSVTREELFELTVSGIYYFRDDISNMWFAWNLARGVKS